MSDRTYRLVLILLIVTGILSCILFTAYTVREYLNCSIIAFISKEWWPK